MTEVSRVTSPRMNCIYKPQHLKPELFHLIQSASNMAASGVEQSFKDQVVVITGGAQGIGYGIAEYLGARGAFVVLFDVKEDKLKEAVASLAEVGVKAGYEVINVTQESEWAAAVGHVAEEHKRIDVLVQAAGITGKTGIKTPEVDPSNFDAVMAVNTKGVFLGARAVLPTMVARNYGRIVNIASVAGKEGNAGMLAYSASKGAVRTRSKWRIAWSWLYAACVCAQSLKSRTESARPCASQLPVPQLHCFDLHAKHRV